MRNLFASELSARVLTDSRIQVIAGDLGFGVLDNFAFNYPDNYLNLGITEQATMSIAAGMAFKGLRPFVYSIANFPTFRCMEQIRNDVHAMGLPVTIVAVGSGLGYGKAGYSHFAVEDISAIRALSNINIYNPSNADELRLSLDSILSNESPSYLRIGGKLSSENLVRDFAWDANSDVHLVYSGDVASIVLDAAESLKFDGVNVAVQSIWNLSNESIDKFLLSKPKKIVSIEEHVLTGGFSSLLLERVSDLKLNIEVERIGISKIDPDIVGSQEYLRMHYGITSREIAARAKQLLGSN